MGHLQCRQRSQFKEQSTLLACIATHRFWAGTLRNTTNRAPLLNHFKAAIALPGDAALSRDELKHLNPNNVVSSFISFSKDYCPTS